MKEEIEFRAFDEGNKVMHYNFQYITSQVENDTSGGSDWIIFISDKFPLTNKETNPFENPNPFFREQLKIMQYSGIKDIDGKKIFSGDVVYLAGLGNLEIEFPFTDLYMSAMENDVGKILGNIYEHPELTEKKKGIVLNESS